MQYAKTELSYDTDFIHVVRHHVGECWRNVITPLHARSLVGEVSLPHYVIYMPGKLNTNLRVKSFSNLQQISFNKGHS